jgi:hypothetical protein
LDRRAERVDKVTEHFWATCGNKSATCEQLKLNRLADEGHFSFRLLLENN